METPHNFQRSSENDRNICFFCDNVWPTLNNVVTSFQTCSICGGSIHSNCKHLAGYCLLCESPQRYNPPERSIVYGGQLNISVRHVYDITITEGATVYGKLILSEATTKTKFQTFISKECIWSEPDVLKVLGVKANMNVFKFELWSSGFIEFFDQIWYACEIDLRPVFWHPNSKIDRWFVFHKVSNDGIHGSVGKVLVDFEYVLPPELLHSPNHSFESINSQIPGDITTSENAKSENPGKTIEEMEVTKLDVCEISHISSNDDDEDTEEKKLISSEVEGELCAVQKLQEIVEAVEKTNSNPTKSSPSVTESSRISSFFTDSVEKTVSTLGNLLYELETTALNEKIEEKQHPLKPAQNNQPPEHSKEDEMQDETISVGKLVMKIETVFKYDVRDAAEGDHYFTVEIDNEVKFKSRIVRNSATPIFNCSVSLQIPHFRAIVDVNLYDAQSASKIGSARLTAYQIMQRKADAKYWKSLGYVDNTISIYDTSGRQEIGYYTGSFSFEEDVYHHYYSSAVRYSASSPEEDLSVERLGIHISRFTEIINFFSKCYQEYLSIMDWSDPILTSFLFLLFLYCTLQVNPDYGMSGIFFCIVLLMTRTFIRRTNGEYLRVYLAKGMKEVVPDYRPLAELKIGVLAFRLRHPKSLLSPSPISSNSSVPSSSTFGFLVPSSSSTDDQHSRPPVLKVSFSPLRETDSGNEREYLVGYLGVSDTAMTTTGASGVTQFVNSFLGSETNKQYWHITNVIDIWKSAVDRSVLDKIGGIKGCIPAGSADCCLVFRIPQPIISKLLPGEKDPIPSGNSRKSFQKGDSTTSDKIMQNEIPEPVSDGMVTPFLSWAQNRSTLTIFLQYEVGNTLSPDKEEEQIHISIKDLIHYGTPNCPDLKKATSFELVKWFKAQKKNDKGPSGTSKKKRGSGSSHNNDLLDHTELSTDSYDQDHSVYHYFSDNSQDTKNEGVRSSAPSNSNPTDSTEVLLRISFTLPDERETLSPNENEKRISQTLQTILSGRIDKESNTFTVLWNMRDHVRYVQNLMNWLLDLIESFKNIFNWTLPEKTFPIYVAFVAIWVLTVFIPGRIIILGIGLYEFLYIFLPIPDGNEISIRFANLLNSIPNDDDLVQIYSKEREKYREQKKQLQKKQLYHILLNTSLPCRWFGKVSMKWSSGSSMTVAGESEWIDAIILLQGKRILWWKDENNQQISENNEVEVPDKPPKGQVLLTAHSGITQVSPVDLRVLSAKITDVTIDKLISIFGQDPSGKPAKLTICFNSNETKRKIESIISNMVGK